MKHLSGRLGVLAALLVLPLLASSPVHAGWQWLYPTPQGNTLRDVAFLTATTAIAVGDAGTIMVSHDAGLTWTVANKVNGIETPLNKISRVDATTAIVVGNAGVILKTTDAGATWQGRASGTSLDLIDVAFAGPDGMAVAATTILRSVDAGDSWTPVTGPAAPFGGVEVVSATLAFVAADYAVWRTTDGGLNWTSYFFGGQFTDLSFADAVNGAAVNSSYLFVTADGGATWDLRPIEPGQSETGMSVRDIEMIDPLNIVFAATATICDIYSGYRCSTYGEAQATANGGTWWTIEQVTRALNGVAVNDDGVRLFVGDGGVVHRWIPPAAITQVAGNPDEALTGGALAFAGVATGIAVHVFDDFFQAGYEYSVFLRTSDGGVNWSKSYASDVVMRDVAFSPSAGPAPPAYAVGFDTDDAAALLTKSTDGGATWTPLWSDPAYPTLRAIAFAGPTHAVAVGDAGTVVLIDNDVATPSTPAPGASLRAIAFASPTTAAAVGFSGPAGALVAVILRTTDAGASWMPVSNSASDLLYGVAFATDQIGLAVGTHGAILRTTDGGQGWDVLPSLTEADLFAVTFIDQNRGYICGANGTVLETSDAGASWTPIESPTTVSLADVEPFGATGAYFGGSGPTVLKYLQQPVPTLITSFNAVASSFAVRIAWDVHDAIGLDHFRIARTDANHTFHEYIATAERRVLRDDDVSPGATYEYQLFAVDRSGDEFASAPVRVTIPAADVALLPNVPNPFNPSTTLRFVVPARERVTLAIYDVAGRHVTTLVDAVREPGLNSVEWNGTDRSGNPVASGVYLSRLRVGTKSVSRTMVLLK